MRRPHDYAACLGTAAENHRRELPLSVQEEHSREVVRIVLDCVETGTLASANFWRTGVMWSAVSQSTMRPSRRHRAVARAYAGRWDSVTTITKMMITESGPSTLL